ncbi:hypothetical protein FQN57_006131 [Myotisia sp. PD_48]|nr:hypothetical protein FQN57_006131 [Myotisia sp. PD_48]
MSTNNNASRIATSAQAARLSPSFKHSLEDLKSRKKSSVSRDLLKDIVVHFANLNCSVTLNKTAKSPSILNGLSLSRSALSSPFCSSSAIWYAGLWDTDSAQPGWYFFCDNLTDPATLAEVIGVEDVLELKPHAASLTGWRFTESHGGPALVGTEDSSSIVRGVAFWIDNAVYAQKLESYKTPAFTLTTCRILLLEVDMGQELVPGQAFIWNEGRNPLDV